jgi:hypothetical protein
VVLRRRERKNRFAVGNDDEARFFTVEKFLDDDSRTRIAELVAGQHVGRGLLGLFQRACHDHAFACREAVGLDDDRRTLLADVGKRGLEFREIPVSGCRDMVTREEVLGERFGAFELRSGSAWPEAGKILRPSMSSDDTGTLRTLFSRAVPALPGATSTSSAVWAHFHARACSRPPEPTIKIFMLRMPPCCVCVVDFGCSSSEIKWLVASHGDEEHSQATIP